MSDAEETLMWRGTAASTDVPIVTPQFRSLVLSAVTSVGQVQPISTIIGTAPEAESGTTPLVVVTTDEGTDVNWAMPGTVSTVNGDTPDSQDAHVVTAGAAVVELPKSQASVTTSLGQSATLTVATGAADQPAAEPADDPSAPPLGDLPSDPPADETGPGEDEPPGTPSATESNGNTGQQTIDAEEPAADVLVSDVEITPPSIDAVQIAALADLPAQQITAKSAGVAAAGLPSGYYKDSTWTTYEAYIPAAKIKVPVPLSANCGNVAHAAWVRADFRVSTSPERVPLSGPQPPLAGRRDRPADVRLLRGRLELRQDTLSDPSSALIAWYTRRGGSWLPSRLRPWAARMEPVPETLRVLPLGYRWGSCSLQGQLNIHWATLQLPPDLIDYVLVTPTRTPARARSQRTLLVPGPAGHARLPDPPDYQTRRDQLKRLGPDLWLLVSGSAR
ncbi:MAG: YgjP-like metallopeptidase domain-containing protein [Streptosporangiaceae bacterium]